MTRAKSARSVRRLVLPRVEDMSVAYVSPWYNKRLDRLIGYVRAGRPVWWRREPFHNEPFRDTEPKWHIFTDRIRGDENDSLAKWDFTWRAACGYKRVRPEILFGPLDFKVGAPKKGDRCEKCHEMYAAHLLERRRSENT